MTPRTAPLLFALALACAPPPQGPAPTTVAPPQPPPQPPVVLTVTVESAGLSFTEVERSLTEPLEQALGGVPDLKRMQSESRSGRAELTLTFRPTTDPTSALLAVQAAVQTTRPSLPDDARPIVRARHDPRTAVMFTLQSATLSADQLSGIADAVRGALLTVPDVADVALCGRRTAEIEVTLDLPRLNALGVSPAAVLDALRADHRDVPPLVGARISPRGLEDLGATVLAARDLPVRLRDVATIRRNFPIDTCDAIRLGGEPVLIGVVHARRGVPLDDFKKAVRDQLDVQRARMPANAIGLATPELAPLRIAVDLEVTGDPASALADNAARLDKLLQEADLQVRAYLQAPVAGLHGERTTGDLFVLPTSDEEAARLRLRLSRLAPIGAIGSVADPEDDPLRHAVWVRGPSLDVDRQIASMLSSRLYAVPGVLRARPHDLLHRELLLEVDRYMLGEVGLRQQDLQPALAIALGGATVAALDEGSVATPVVVRLPAASGQSHADRIAQLQALTVTPANGAPVRLDSLLTLSMELQPAAIVRHDRQRAVRVDIYYSDRQAGEAAFAEAAKTMELPSDLTLVWE